MNIQSVSVFDNAVQELNAIKGNVTAEQLESLTELFSTQIWNTSDAEDTTASLERQIQQLQALLDEIDEEIESLYNDQKYANEEMNKLVNDLNEESYQASKQADRNIKEQQDLVTAATDEAYNAYMKGDIEKEEIPMFIANKLKNGNQPGGAAMQAHLEEMDTKGQKITNLSNKIAGILDSINEYTSKYKTTKASLDLLKQLKAQVPAKKNRADITTNIAHPYFSPSQEALGDKLIDKYTVAAAGEDTYSSESPAVNALGQAVKSSGIAVTDERKAELDAMSPEAKAAAVEEFNTGKYSALELMYMSGMDKYQAASAIASIFGNAHVGYNKTTGALAIPYGHDDASRDIYSTLVNQYKTLWQGDVDEEGEPDIPPTPDRTDPIGWRQGDTNFMFAIDRNNDNIFNGAEEYVGAQEGWAELAGFDDNGDNILSAEELAAHDVRVVDVNQALTNGGLYGFNGVKESGFESLNLASYNQISDLKNTNINGNKRVAEFDLVVNGQALVGKQTENTEAYNDLFYGHMYGEAYSFGLDPDEVAQVLAEAAQPRDYTSSERAESAQLVKKSKQVIEDDASTIVEKDETLARINSDALDNKGQGLDRVEDEEENNEEQPVEETTVSSEAETDTADVSKKKIETEE